MLIGPPPPGAQLPRPGGHPGGRAAHRRPAIHPGYGFLSENADFARQVVAAGLTWVGPPPAAIEQMGDKISARNLMAAGGSAGGRGHGRAGDRRRHGGGRRGRDRLPGHGEGRGGRRRDRDERRRGRRRAARRRSRPPGPARSGSSAARRSCWSATSPPARHVEVQILGLAGGRVLALGERDCSVQRRHQKVAEETPSPGVGPELRGRMLAAAVRAGEAVGYRGAGRSSSWWTCRPASSCSWR